MVSDQEYKLKLEESRATLKTKEEESKEITAVFLKVKGLIKDKQKLAKFKEPVVFLERRSGTVDLFEGITTTEWEVPDQEVGRERKIHFTTPPKRFNYAGDTFRFYYCHEDYAFPIDCGYNMVYDKETKAYIGVDLRAANIAAEALRDLIRKVLVAWEKYKTTAEAANMQAWLKIILWGLGILVGGYILYKLLIKQEPPTPTEVQAAVNTTRVVIG